MPLAPRISFTSSESRILGPGGQRGRGRAAEVDVATLAVFVVTLYIQRANRRDDLALHAKLDELLRVDHAARSELTQLDEQEPEVIERRRDEEVRKSKVA